MAEDVAELTGEFLYTLKKSTGKTRREICEMTGLTMGQVGGRIWRHEQRLQHQNAPPEKPDLFRSRLGAPLELDGDWVIVGDVQIPTTDYDFSMLPAIIGERLGVGNLLIAGDLINQDVFSSYAAEYPVATWEEERRAAQHLMSIWALAFERIVWLAGNHERRAARSTGGEYQMEELQAQVCNGNTVEVSRWGWCTIDSPTGVWRVTHPKRYSRIPLRLANSLALKYGQHIISMHEHHLGATWSDDGKHVIANGGGLFDEGKMGYVVLDDTNSPRMAKGFTSLVGGYLTVYGEAPYTNWDALLEDAAEAVPLLRAA